MTTTAKVITTQCDCGHIAKSSGISTGYGTDKDNKKICFKCCGKNDRKELIETGKSFGYLVKKGNGWYFTNWPGSFEIRVLSTRQSHHNFAGRNGRTDFWLFFEGHNYHGVNIGDNQCARLKRTK